MIWQPEKKEKEKLPLATAFPRFMPIRSVLSIYQFCRPFLLLHPVCPVCPVRPMRRVREEQKERFVPLLSLLVIPVIQ